MMTGNGKGFEIALHAARSLIKTRAWGCWDEDIVKKYDRALREKIEEFKADGTGWYALVDVRRFSACSEDVRTLLSEYLSAAWTQGLKKIAYLGTGILSRSQDKRGFEKDDPLIRSFLDSENEAIQWLLHGQ